jgi:hypothetical protein
MQHSNDLNVILQTSTSGGWKQIVATVVLSIGVSLALYMLFFESRPEDPIYLKAIVVIIALLFYWRIVGSLARSWLRDAYQLQLDGGRIVARTLFGKVFQVSLGEIVNVKQLSGRHALLFETKDRVFAINPAMDYIGFIYDYILERIPANASVDSKIVEKLRCNGGAWSYTRTYPFATSYTPEQSAEITRIVEDQRGRLVKSGILQSDVFYGDARANDSER